MSGLPVETTEPDPAATSLPNDETVNKPAVETNELTAKDSEHSEDKSEAAKTANGTAEANEEKATEDEKKNGDVVESAVETGAKSTDGQAPRRPFKKFAKGPNKSKYDASVLESSGDHKQIRAQVEFYLGDANLPTDDFLWELTDGAKNKPVPIFTICKFGRMKRFEDYNTVVEALRGSQVLVVAGEKGAETVARKFPYDPKSARTQVLARSVYAKGFGEEIPSSQFDIEAFFATYGQTNAVRLRRTADKLFKGSVFVEFATEEDARKFMELDPKPKWKGKDELLIKWKKEYMDGKEEDIREGRLQPQESHNFDGRNKRGSRGRGDRGGRGGRGGRGRGDRDRGRDRGDRDPDDWKKRREDDRASGFKNDRKNDRGRGRGRGRGGHRGGRDGSDRNGDSDIKKDETSDKTITKDKIENSTKPEETKVNQKKRAREDDGTENEAPAKKLDTKSEQPAAAVQESS